MTDFGDNGGAEMMARQQANPAGGEPVREILEHHLIETLALPDQAVAWLMGMWDAIQFLDDVADGDIIFRDQIDRALNQLLVAMPSNPFFVAHASALLPVVAVQLLKWQASDKAEREGFADARSYMWRAGYYDLVLLVVQICHGYDIAVNMAPVVMGLYGEKLEDYQKEFEDA
jgi:hypothetical protein